MCTRWQRRSTSGRKARRPFEVRTTHILLGSALTSSPDGDLNVQSSKSRRRNASNPGLVLSTSSINKTANSPRLEASNACHAGPGTHARSRCSTPSTSIALFVGSPCVVKAGAAQLLGDFFRKTGLASTRRPLEQQYRPKPPQHAGDGEFQKRQQDRRHKIHVSSLYSIYCQIANLA